MANRLAVSLSPYLRQHADNPVEWHEWGAQAFDEARRRDVPVLLSVGYAACHWCHVMAHESFEDASVAAGLNANYVAIKVDREERPDVDAVYMAVTQALTGHGGWPMTVVLTPEAEPIFAGTYFPRDHFLQVLGAIAQIWRDDRPRALEVGRSIVTALQGRQGERGSAGDIDLTRAVASLRRSFDDARAGFGGAPKFPPSMTLEHLLRHHARSGDADALAMVRRTCEAMARGGLYDQLDGGFARYSVDAEWVVPHFEKMLYDNAQLLRVYTHLWRATGEQWARRVALDTADFMRRRLLTDEGAFASALDADTDGVEGLTYAWTPEQLRDVLGDDDGARAAEILGVTTAGTFEGGASTLRWLGDLDEDATHETPSGEWWADVRTKLARARGERPQPARDDKVVTSWNGLAIAALAEAAMILDTPELLDVARRVADVVLTAHVVDGRLRRTSLGGRVSDALACADDYGNLAEALLVLHQATGETSYLRDGLGLLDAAVGLFIDGDDVYDTGVDAESLVVRPRSDGDNAEPSGASSLASAFVMAFALTGETGWREHAERCLGALAGVMAQNPRFAGWALATAEALADGPVQVAIVEHGANGHVLDSRVPGGDDDESVGGESLGIGSNGTDTNGTGSTDAGVNGADRRIGGVQGAAARGVDGRGRESARMWRVAWQSTRPGLVRVRGAADAPGIPLLANRPSTDESATAYVCRGFVCDAPVTRADQMSI